MSQEPEKKRTPKGEKVLRKVLVELEKQECKCVVDDHYGAIEACLPCILIFDIKREMKW